MSESALNIVNRFRFAAVVYQKASRHRMGDPHEFGNSPSDLAGLDPANIDDYWTIGPSVSHVCHDSIATRIVAAKGTSRPHFPDRKRTEYQYRKQNCDEGG